MTGLVVTLLRSGLPDIQNEPERVMPKLLDKFRLELSEEAACDAFQALVEESVHAMFPAMMETIHKWAQYWRK
mgnify:CR=1 FL=1